jgi:hypothetical protein
MNYRFLSLILILLVAACSSTAPGDESVAPPPTAAPATAVVVGPTTTAEASATEQPPRPAPVVGRRPVAGLTAILHGAPDAPVMFIDYLTFSDDLPRPRAGR